MGRTEGWLFPSRRSKSGPIVSVEKQWLNCRRSMGLDSRYVLYSGRHTFGTNPYSDTGNLKPVMAVMGHRDVKLPCYISIRRLSSHARSLIAVTGTSIEERTSNARVLRHESRHSRILPNF